MGLVQSQKDQTEDTIEVEGVLFRIEQNLKRYIHVYGNLVIDFRKVSFFGEDFTVNFSRQGSC